MSFRTTGNWRYHLGHILANGAEVAPNSAGSDWKGRTTKECLAYTTSWDMDRPVIVSKQRKIGFRFMAAEAAWILGGQNDLASIAPFSKNMQRFSDDGFTLMGAYGPPYADQVWYAVKALADDPATRQALVSIWRPRPMSTKDTPCTLSLQWLIRDDALNCIATMRSSDMWHGIPYDIFSFSMMSVGVLIRLRSWLVQVASRIEPQPRQATPTDQVKKHEELIRRAHSLRLGQLYLTAGSQHLYKTDWEEAAKCCEETDAGFFDVAPIDPTEFATPQHLVEHLWRVAKREPLQKGGPQFLKELYAS